MSGNKLIRELERIIEKEKPKEEIVPDEDISFTLPNVSTVSDGQIFEKEQEKKREEEEQIKSEIDLQKLKDELDVGEVLKELEFYFGSLNKKFFYACQNLGLHEDNTSFINFLSSDIGSQIFREYSLSIHIETGNVYFDGYNTNESIYEFLLSQQDETKQKVHATLSYSDTFSNYMRNFLDDIDHETVDKYNVFTNKNVKYLSHRFNDFLLFRGQPILTLRHSKELSMKL